VDGVENGVAKEDASEDKEDAAHLDEDAAHWDEDARGDRDYCFDCERTWEQTQADKEGELAGKAVVSADMEEAPEHYCCYCCSLSPHEVFWSDQETWFRYRHRACACLAAQTQ